MATGSRLACIIYSCQCDLLFVRSSLDVILIAEKPLGMRLKKDRTGEDSGYDIVWLLSLWMVSSFGVIGSGYSHDLHIFSEEGLCSSSSLSWARLSWTPAFSDSNPFPLPLFSQSVTVFILLSAVLKFLATSKCFSFPLKFQDNEVQPYFILIPCSNVPYLNLL